MPLAQKAPFGAWLKRNTVKKVISGQCLGNSWEKAEDTRGSSLREETCSIVPYRRHLLDRVTEQVCTLILHRTRFPHRPKMATKDSTVPLRTVKAVQFGILSPEEIVSATQRWRSIIGCFSPYLARLAASDMATSDRGKVT